MLPGEIRNSIYRNYFDVTKLRPIYAGAWVDLFSAQPALTRVNKQVRAESLSIYYAEKHFVLEIYLSDHRPIDDRYKMRYADFCRVMDVFGPAKDQSRTGSSPLRYIRNLNLQIVVDLNPERCSVIFGKTRRTDMSYCGRLGGDETDWADRTAVREIVKQWARRVPRGHPQCVKYSNVQERLIHVLWLLGVTISSEIWGFFDPYLG